MVFSFFKKSAEKMPERAPVRPKAGAASPSTDSGPESLAPETRPPAASEEDWDLDFSSVSNQPGGGYGIEIHEESDPFAEIAEHVAILYANGQIEAARTTLESTLHGNHEPGAVKLWAMLFDLLRIKGERPAFDALGLEFASVCELSPPSWELEPTATKVVSKSVAGSVVLQGVMSGDDPVFITLSKAVDERQVKSLDFARLAGLDMDASATLASLLHQARRRKLGWELAGEEGLAGRLANRTIVGQAQEEPLWLLLLELYQYLGWEAQFEEKAVDYAVTFEVSPPSWEVVKPVVRKQTAEAAAIEVSDEGAGGLCPLEGEILQGNLKDVSHYLKPGEECRLDFSRVTRLDFVSAGALANLLKTAGAGPVVIYHPNRLVAELMRVMGVSQVARVEISKH